MSIHADTIGHGQEIVLLHGWGMHGGIWKPVAEELAINRRVTTIDLPGYGSSDLPTGNYDINCLVSEIIPVIPDKAVLIGWSLGGLLAMQLYRELTSHIDKLVLVCSTPQFIRSPDWPFAVEEKTLEEFSTMLEEDHNNTIQRFLKLQVLGSEDGKKILRDMQKELMSAREPETKALRGGLSILQNTNLRPYLAEIQCPTLIISGQHDTLVPADSGSLIHDIIPCSRLHVIKGAGHVPFLSHPGEFLTTVKRFLDD